MEFPVIFDVRFDVIYREDRLHRRNYIELEEPTKLQKKEILGWLEEEKEIHHSMLNVDALFLTKRGNVYLLKIHRQQDPLHLHHTHGGEGNWVASRLWV